MTHDHVVFVGVYADAVGLGECPFQQSVSSFVSRLSYSDAVDDMVWRVVQPLAVVYPCVCRVRARDEGHCGKDPARLLAKDIAYASGDVLPDNVFGGVAVIPLVHVSACTHDLSGATKYLHQLRNVLVCGLTYHFTSPPRTSAS